jgi:hypothetical protein
VSFVGQKANHSNPCTGTSRAARYWNGRGYTDWPERPCESPAVTGYDRCFSHLNPEEKAARRREVAEAQSAIARRKVDQARADYALVSERRRKAAQKLLDLADRILAAEDVEPLTMSDLFDGGEQSLDAMCHAIADATGWTSTRAFRALRDVIEPVSIIDEWSLLA